MYLLHLARKSLVGAEQRRIYLPDEGPDDSVPKGNGRRSLNPRTRLASCEGCSSKDNMRSQSEIERLKVLRFHTCHLQKRAISSLS